MNTEFEVLTDTLMHISEVQENIEKLSGELRKRGIAHDRSKLMAVEFDGFVKSRPKFKKANYGTPEYQECVDMIKPSVEHHYKNNRHHTAYHENGIKGMNLIDVCEMVCDWVAASRRSPDQTLHDSLSYAFKKYEIDGVLQDIIKNTFKDFGWGDK